MNVGQKVQYCEGSQGSRIHRAYVTEVHSETCVNLRVCPDEGKEFTRSSVAVSAAPAAGTCGWWNERQIKEWEQPGSASGPLTSGDFKRVRPPVAAPAPAAEEKSEAPASEEKHAPAKGKGKGKADKEAEAS